jgi:transposase
MSDLAMARFGDSSPRRRSPLKKIVCAIEQDRPDIAAERMRWQEDQEAAQSQASRVHRRDMSKDQHGAHAWSVPARPKALCQSAAWHSKTTTFVAALRHDGITAPFLDGPINGECFLAYVKEMLAPTLSEGDIVLIDNLASHKSPKIRKAIEAEGAELRFLPRYSPDLNPIEMAFSELKTLLRNASDRFVKALCSPGPRRAPVRFPTS